MASRVSRLPAEQLREKEKDGRIRRFICDVLTLRVLAYIWAQPASFTFILSFLLITLTMPPMAAYIKHAGKLPDLDTMRSWNAYLGRLPSQRLCVNDESYEFSSYSAPPQVASAFIDFHVDGSVFDNTSNMLFAILTGTSLKTKIKNSTSNERIDDLISVTIFIPMTNVACNSSCTVRGCVDIAAPDIATPARHPQIPNTDFTFKTRVLQSTNRPEDGPESSSCYQSYSQKGATRNLTVGERCKDVRPLKEKYRKHGLINIYLTEDQQLQSYRRIILGTFAVAVIGLAFAVGIGCTERPPKPKNRPE